MICNGLSAFNRLYLVCEGAIFTVSNCALKLNEIAYEKNALYVLTAFGDLCVPTRRASADLCTARGRHLVVFPARMSDQLTMIAMVMPQLQIHSIPSKFSIACMYIRLL